MLSKAVQPGRSRPEAHSPWQSCCRVSLPVSCVRCDASSSAQHPAPTPPPTATPDPSRRNLLQLATVGSLSAWAARNVDAADAASGAALAASLGSDGSGGGSSSALLERRLGDALSEFELSNGLRFLVFERHTAPVVSFHVYADVGAYDEEDGQTGIAHLLEHMAFKGTRRLGTTDAAREGRLLDELDDAFYSLLAAAGQDGSAEAARLQRQFDELQQQASALSVPNAYGSLIVREGGVGLNAATSYDSTQFYSSWPANKLELWFALEAERFQQPVFRDLYREKQVVLEERRMRVDNSALGAFTEQFALASLSNNYRRPVIGFPADLQRLGRREVQSFFGKHYTPGRLVVAVAGDVRAADVRRLAERYFGGWQPSQQQDQPASSCTGEEALPVPAVPRGAWHYEAPSKAGPALQHAYYRPCIKSPDAVPLELVGDLLSGTRSSRLYRSLVLDGKALAAAAYSSYPADKHATQFSVYAVPTKGRSLERLDADISAELAALAGDGPTAEELRRYKKGSRMEVLSALGSNSAIAAALATSTALTGSWRRIAADLDRVEGLQAGEVRDTAARHLRPDNCFKGYVLPSASS